MVPEIKEQIDKDAAAAFMHTIVKGWSDLDEDPIIELRCLFPDRSTNISHYSPDNLGISLLIDHAVIMNGHGLNVYPIVNPVRASAVYGGIAATDKDILASFYFWADADDEAATYAIRNFAGPKYTMSVLTGKIPFARPHIYWRMADGPMTDLKAWTRIQKGIAAQLSTDKSVVNPSRIMRLPGLVNWPTPDKVKNKGRVPEIATFRTQYEDDRPPVMIERMERIFGGAEAIITPPTGGDSFDIEALPESLDRDQTRAQALSGEEWHNNIIRLVGSYVSRGLEDEEIHQLTDPLTLPGYTIEDTRREVQTAIDGARRKGWTPAEPTSFRPDTPQQNVGSVTEWPTPLSDFDETALPRRRWIYGYDYIRRFVSVVASAGGVGKTSNAIVEALAIVTDRPLLKTAVKEQTRVWIINLEDPRDEIVMRTLAAMKHYGIKPEDVQGKLFLDGEDTLSMTLAIEDRNGVTLNEDLIDKMKDRILAEDIGVVIIDPFVSTHMVNENSNASIQAVVALLRSLARETGAAICLVHHTRKGNGEDANVDSVRGAGSLIGAARAARVVNRISERAAVEMGIPLTDAKGIFRIDDGKSNLAPPAEKAVYRKMIGVELDNGEWVGVAVPYELPDEWAGMTEDVTNTILGLIDAGHDKDNPGGELYSLRRQDKRWVGNVITEYPFSNADHFKSQIQAKMIVDQWLKNGLIEEVEYRSAAQRKDRKGVLATGRVGGKK